MTNNLYHTPNFHKHLLTLHSSQQKLTDPPLNHHHLRSPSTLKTLNSKSTFPITQTRHNNHQWNNTQSLHTLPLNHQHNNHLHQQSPLQTLPKSQSAHKKSANSHPQSNKSIFNQQSQKPTNPNPSSFQPPSQQQH